MSLIASPQAAAGPWQRHCRCRAVHLNLPFEEPLHASVAEQEDGLAALISSQVDPVAIDSATPLPFNAPRCWILPCRCGGGPWRGLASLGPYQQAVDGWLRRSGWPLLADPLSALPVDLPGRLPLGLLLGGLPVAESLQVLRLGPCLPAAGLNSGCRR